jgi:pectinesterase
MLLAMNGQLMAAERYDAVVDVEYGGKSGRVVEGAAHFTSVGASLEFARKKGRPSFRVLIRNGLYREKLLIDQPGVQFTGESEAGTVISWNDNGDSPAPDGSPLGTHGSATLTIAAPGFQVRNLTVENTFDYAANAALPDGNPGKVARMQAVAVMTTGDSDRSLFENVTIRGHQDTLFVDAGRHYFRDCRILGHVDFIFGAGQAVFEACDIVSRNRTNTNPTGYITAPSTDIAQPYGLLFLDSRLLRETADVPAASVRLGRPWHPAADPSANGSAVFVRCYMDEHIGPEGYAPISAVDSEGRRIWFEVDATSRFFEYGSYGPGGARSEFRPQLTARQAEWFTPNQVLNGWKPVWNQDLR